MQTPQNVIIAADLLQIAVVGVAVTIFLYLRIALGVQARFLIHLALAYVGVGVFYVFGIVTSSMHEEGLSGAMIEIVGSTLSFMNTAFFFTAWYLMRDMRLRHSNNSDSLDNLGPTMSKPFVAGVIVALMASIAGYIAMVGKLAQNPELLTLFEGIDAFLSTIALVCVGSEFALMKMFPDKQEGSLFRSRISHGIFKVLALVLFILWGVMQWGRVIWIASGKGWVIVTPYTGQWYQWSAMIKILCGGSGAILALHALPSTRWKHKRGGRK
jgi:flagellar biogenesis protein FliO